MKRKKITRELLEDSKRLRDAETPYPDAPAIEITPAMRAAAEEGGADPVARIKKTLDVMHRVSGVDPLPTRDEVGQLAEWLKEKQQELESLGRIRKRMATAARKGKEPPELIEAILRAADQPADALRASLSDIDRILSMRPNKVFGFNRRMLEQLVVTNLREHGVKPPALARRAREVLRALLPNEYTDDGVVQAVKLADLATRPTEKNRTTKKSR